MPTYQFIGYFEVDADIDEDTIASKVEEFIPFHVDGLEVTKVED